MALASGADGCIRQSARSFAPLDLQSAIRLVEAGC